MRRNDVIDRFRFLVGHSVERSLKFMLRMFNIAKNWGIKELIFVEDDVSRIDNALVHRIP